MKQLLIAIIAIPLLCACEHEAGLRDNDEKDYQAHFGKAVRQNIDAQIVNPDAPSTDTLEHSGPRVVKAQKAYAEDKVEKPERTQTLESTEGDDDGGGGN